MREDMTCEPNNFYGLSKYLGEKLVEYAVANNGLKAVTVRPFMFYDEDEDLGEHRSAMIRFVEALLKRERVVVHNGAMRSWMHISDAVRALEKCMYVNDYEVINIGHHEVFSVDDLAGRICEALNLEKESYIQREDLPEHMTLTKFPNLDKQDKLLKITPSINLDEGIKRVINGVSKKITANQPLGGGDISAAEYWVSSVGV